MSTNNRALLAPQQVEDVRQMMFNTFVSCAVQQLLPLDKETGGTIHLDRGEFTWSLKPKTQTKENNHEAR